MPGAPGRGRRRRRRGRRGLGLLRLHPARELEQQLRAIELLGATSAVLSAQERELVTERGDEVLLHSQFGAQLCTVMLEIRRIGGQFGHRCYRCIAPGHRFAGHLRQSHQLGMTSGLVLAPRLA